MRLNIIDESDDCRHERLCVVMPVYNEREAIGGVLAKWAQALDALGVDYVIRPYNDGSKDDSLAVMREAAKALPRVEVRDKPNGGHGNTILTGYRDAAADGFDWVFQIDSDDEMGPEKFGELWAKRADYDFLVGIRDGRVQQLPRKIISFVSRLCVRLFYGKSVWDVNTPYRLMRVSAFAPFFSAIPLTTFAPNVILSGLAARNRLRSYEIRVPQHDRTTGEVSIKKWKLLKASARSFWQTVVYSFHGGSMRSLVILLSCVGMIWGGGALLKSPLLFLPTSDHYVYMMAGKIMSYGGVLYRDFFDHKGPVFLAFNALGWLLTGDAWGVWTIEFLFRLVAVGCFFVGAIRRIGTVGAFVGAIAFVFHPALANYPETFALDSSMMALGLVMMRPAADLSWIVVGLLGAAAVFSKQTCISVFFGLVVYLVLGRNWRPVLYSIVGGVATSALIVAAILFWGDVAAWWDCTYRFNALQGGHLRAVAIHKAILIVANTSLYWCVACVGLFLAVRGRIVGRRIIVSWVLAVVSEVVLLSCGSGPYFYQAYCLQFLLMLPGVVACAGWYRNDARVLGRCACVLICSAAVLGSMPNFARAMQNVAYLMHDDHQLAEGNGEMDYRAQMCRFLNSLPQGDLIVYDNYCRYFLETKHKCPIAPYYYSVPFLVPGYLNSSQMDDLEAKVASKDLIVVTRCELRDSHDGSMESILAARVSQPDITRIELPRCGTAYVAKKLLK